MAWIGISFYYFLYWFDEPPPHPSTQIQCFHPPPFFCLFSRRLSPKFHVRCDLFRQQRKAAKLYFFDTSLGILELDAAAWQEAGCLAQPQEDPSNLPNDWQQGRRRCGLWRGHHHLLRGGNILQPDPPPHFLCHVYSPAVLGLRTLQSRAQQPHFYRQGLSWRETGKEERTITMAREKWQWFISALLETTWPCDGNFPMSLSDVPSDRSQIKRQHHIS